MSDSVSHDRTTERLRLLADTVVQTRSELRLETDPELRADLLILTEELAEEVLELLFFVRDVAWNLPTPEHPVPVPDPDRP